MTFNGSHTLVITDLPATTDFEGLGNGADVEKLTIVPLHHDHRYPTASERVNYQPPHVYIWHEALGRTIHRDLEKISQEVATNISSVKGHLSGSPKALAFAIVDSSLWNYLLLRRVSVILESDPSCSGIALYLEDKELWRAAREAFRDFERGLIFEVHADFRSFVPIVRKPRLLLFRTLRVRKNSLGKARRYLMGIESCARWIQNKAKPRTSLGNEIAEVVNPLLRATSSGPSPAIVGWLSRDNNYAVALIRVLREILQIRPVILLIEGSGGNIDERLAELADSAPYGIYTIRVDDLMPLARRYGKEISDKALTALTRTAAEGSRSAVDKAILQYCIKPFLQESSRVQILGAINELMRQLTVRPLAYGLFASGRSSNYAAVAEWLHKDGSPSVDVHIYLVGNHARQIAPPTTYAAVIDDQQERVVSDFWGWPSHRCIRVGYLWREPAESNGKPAERNPFRPAVMICTQPGDTEMVKSFFSDVVTALAPLNGAQVWLKPHPAESQAILAFYEKIIIDMIGGDRVRIFGAKDRLTDLLPAADIVVTRTSNAGIEAALMEKPTLRYLAYDKYDVTVERSVTYAKTVWARDELASCLSELVTDPEARHRQILDQSAYLDANPAQASADGPYRLVSFLELQLKGGKNQSSAIS